MSTVIQNLIHKQLGDGARSSKFECLVIFKSSALFVDGEMAALVKTSQFPGKSHEIIDFKYKGRNIPIKGQVKYDNTWTCTFYLTQDHKLKKGFEDWIESIDQVHNIKEVSKDVLQAQNDNADLGYTTTMTIYQMDFEARRNTVAYHMRYAFPKSVSMVEVDYSLVGTVLEFTVEFSYAYFDTENMTSEKGNFVDEMKDKAMKAAKGFVSGLKDQAVGFATEQGKKLSNKFGFGGDTSKESVLLGGGGGGGIAPATKDQQVLIKVSGIDTYVSGN